MKTNVTTKFIFEYKVNLHDVETDDDYFTCHMLYFDDPQQIILFSNSLWFRCPICLDMKNSQNSIIQPCGHCLCQNCALQMMNLIDEPERKKYMLYQCSQCRHFPTIKPNSKDNATHHRGPIIVRWRW